MLKFVVLSIIFGWSVGSTNKSCYRALNDKRIIQQFAGGIKTTDLEVYYSGKRVNCGDNVMLAEALQAPTLRLNLTSRCTNVTMVSFTADNEIGPPFVRWIVVNIPSWYMAAGFDNGGALGDGGKKGDVIAVYSAPKDPTAGLGRNNTIVYFIYCQCRYISNTKKFLVTDRYSFDVKGFAKKNGMKCPVDGWYNMNTITPINVQSPAKVPTLPVKFSPSPNVPLASSVPV